MDYNVRSAEKFGDLKIMLPDRKQMILASGPLTFELQKHLKDFKLYPSTKSSIEKLKRLKFLIFVVTNQPDIGNKFVSRKIVNQMHFLLKKKLQLMKLKFVHMLKVMDVYVVNQVLK